MNSRRNWTRSKAMNLIQKLEEEEIKRMGRKLPEFSAGDTVIVNVSVVEGESKRVQAYEGVVIAKKNRGINSLFTVRKVSSGEGVERTFQTYSPMIASIELKRKGDVRRAKLYYMRKLSGKGARIREKIEGQEQGAEQELPSPSVNTLLPPGEGMGMRDHLVAAGRCSADRRKIRA